MASLGGGSMGFTKGFSNVPNDASGGNEKSEINWVIKELELVFNIQCNLYTFSSIYSAFFLFLMNVS